jgi:transcriptional regulator GlxA family with amidase domain
VTRGPTTPRNHPVTVVAFDGLQLLDLAGPVEVLDAADRIAGRRLYEVRIATPGGGAVRSTSRVEVGADVDLHAVARPTVTADQPKARPTVTADQPKAGPTVAAHRPNPAAPERIGTLLVVGGFGTRALLADEPVLASVRALADRADRVTSVCTGALVLAAAGLLDGYRATTHWASCDLLDTYPDVEVEPDRIYVHDRDRWTSAGVTAGIDLALALVEADHGPELAHEIASYLVVFARRPGGQAQFSASLRAQPARSPAIAAIQRWLPDHLDEDLAVERLADRAGMSSRNFARAFRAETGTTPAAHVEELRVEAARRLLETTDLTVAAVARQVGLRHVETLHRAFHRRTGTTPARYRQHFARRSRRTEPAERTA